jgi:adenylate cyclase class 2
MTDHPLEIEVKFHLLEPRIVRERLLAAGGVSSGRVFEKNLRFDDPARSLRRRGMLLRLRRDDGVRLTVKSTPSSPDSQFKIHQELEVEVGDFDTCRSILEALGFVPRQVYEKWRETFLINHTSCLLDTMPYGTFLELEGEKAAIRETAHRLDLPWSERILMNYLEIFETVRKGEGLDFTDVTFDNFESVNVDIAKYLYLLHAGRT